MKQIGLVAAALCVIALDGGAAEVSGQSYPSKPVRIIGGTAPGGSTDTIARIVTQELSKSWGQNVVVDNRPGAGATIPANLVAKAPPDIFPVVLGAL